MGDQVLLGTPDMDFDDSRNPQEWKGTDIENMLTMFLMFFQAIYAHFLIFPLQHSLLVINNDTDEETEFLRHGIT